MGVEEHMKERVTLMVSRTSEIQSPPPPLDWTGRELNEIRRMWRMRGFGV